jgi:thiamine-phosphate diphosphorylase / hydroxyethylthiazole kinase
MTSRLTSPNCLHRKKDTKNIIGTGGVREILSTLAGRGFKVPTVGIGGINISNVLHTLQLAVISESRGLDGAAVVSAIMAAPDPTGASTELLAAINKVVKNKGRGAPYVVTDVVKAVHDLKPISHNMTNLVRVADS